jgi:hypothetical protein
MLDELKFLKSRAELMFRLFSVFRTEDWLYRWFEAETNILKNSGLVDVNIELCVDGDINTSGTELTLANVYRKRRLDQFPSTYIH